MAFTIFRKQDLFEACELLEAAFAAIGSYYPSAPYQAAEQAFAELGLVDDGTFDYACALVTDCDVFEALAYDTFG